MISAALYSLDPAIVLTSTITHSGSNNMKSFTLTIPAGTVLVARGTDGIGTFFQAVKPLDFVASGTVIPVMGGVYVPTNQASGTEIYWLAVNTNQPVADAHPGIQFKPTTYENLAKDGFKRELLYAGVSQGTVTLSYREFMNDLARPAFSQELRYDLSQGRTIGYKGARFNVIDANNTAIKYVVLKNLD